MNATYTIEYQTNRCYECGSFWAIEINRQAGVTCPRCTRIEVGKLHAETEKLNRTIAALRGVINRRKKS